MSRCAGLDPVDGSWPPPGPVAGSQIVVLGAVVVGAVVVGAVVVGGPAVVVGWAVWRRTGAVRTPLPGLTVAHCWAGRRTLPFFQALVALAHDFAGRRSLTRSRVFQALAVEWEWSLPLRREPAAAMLACPASAGAAMGPATSRAPKPTASHDARRTGRLMLWFPHRSVEGLDAAGNDRLCPSDPCSCASRQARLNHSIGLDRSATAAS
jgi:hypothetical protein